MRGKGIASHFHTPEKVVYGLAVENISLGGLFVRTGDPLPVGASMTLELVKPGLKRAIKITGTVVAVVTLEEAAQRRLAPGMGVRFGALTGETTLRINELLASLTPEGPGVTLGNVEVKPESTSKPAPEVKVVPPTAVAPMPFLDIAVLHEEVPKPRPARSKPAAPPPMLFAKPDVGEEELEAQLAGLIRELGDAHRALAQRSKECDDLRAQVKRLTDESSAVRVRLERLTHKA